MFANGSGRGVEVGVGEGGGVKVGVGEASTIGVGESWGSGVRVGAGEGRAPLQEAIIIGNSAVRNNNRLRTSSLLFRVNSLAKELMPPGNRAHNHQYQNLEDSVQGNFQPLTRLDVLLPPGNVRHHIPPHL